MIDEETHRKVQVIDAEIARCHVHKAELDVCIAKFRLEIEEVYKEENRNEN